MTFAADIRRWATVHDFAQHLAQHDPAICDWAQGFVLHHTWTPTIAQWRGLTSVEGARDYYIHSVPNADGSKGGWPSGPHLFICGDSPNPLYNGIFQLTPLNIPGTHAGATCNRTTWACEVVGRYDNAFWSSATAELVYGVIAALYGWADRDPATITGHRFCLNNKTCPGNQVAARLPAIRDEVKQRLLAGATQPGAALLTEDTPIISAPRATLEQCTKYMLNRAHTNYDEYDIGQVILPRYFEVCQQVGVDPLVAISQMIHETGNLCSFWSARPQRNPAGIGVNGRTSSSQIAGYAWNADRSGRWEAGVSFKTWAADAIPAHVGRLVAYALPHSAWNDAQRELVATALEYRQLASKLWGSAPTLKQLGKAHNPTGDGWASPGTDYGKRIANVMNAIRGQ